MGLTKLIMKVFASDFILAFLLCSVGTCCAMASPFLVNMILKFVEEKNPDTQYGLQLLGYLFVS